MNFCELNKMNNKELDDALNSRIKKRKKLQNEIEEIQQFRKMRNSFESNQQKNQQTNFQFKADDKVGS